jgi:hypothetical protein
MQQLESTSETSMGTSMVADMALRPLADGSMVASCIWRTSLLIDMLLTREGLERSAPLRQLHAAIHHCAEWARTEHPGGGRGKGSVVKFPKDQ